MQSTELAEPIVRSRCWTSRRPWCTRRSSTTSAAAQERIRTHRFEQVNDISVTIAKVPAFLKEIDAIVGEHYPDFEIVWFGHIGDGNLHLNILKPDAMDKDEFFGKCATVNKWVFETVQKYNGSISAEHGVGMTKRDYLEYSRSPVEIEYMKAVKAAFDPNGIMNPGKIFAV